VRIFITGDKHGNFDRVERFCEVNKTTREDILIVLGDAGINYFLDQQDIIVKDIVSQIPITLFCIHGNHEARPETVSTYQTMIWHGGTVYYEQEYPNILFAQDGNVFAFHDKVYLVIGGAYSIDKQIRLARGWKWFSDEQPSEESKIRVHNQLEALDWKIDCILSHTCPVKYEPTEVFLRGFDQSEVDKSTEIWLNKIEYDISHKGNYDAWYCGHYHTEKDIDKMHFMFHDIMLLE
jgi:3-oxoacid CoA-transferase subunit A